MHFFFLLFTLAFGSANGETPLSCPGLAELLAARSPTVLSVEREISDSGGSHAGVYEVKTDLGVLALKVRTVPSPLKPEAVDVQQELSRRGMAPRIRGVIEGATLKALRPALQAKQGKRFPPEMKNDQGIFMDLIPNGWNCPSSDRPLPEAAAKWNKAAILHRIDEIEKALAEMNVQILNPQLLIDADGVAHVIDIEMVARGTKEKPQRTSFHGARRVFLEAWKARFGD